jgi:transcriptional regulator with XRE-family HTH domain
MKVIRSTEFQEQIGRRIFFFRKKKGWTQIELGIASRIDHSIIGKYENGEISIGVQCLQDIMKALGVDPPKFFRSNIFNTIPRH